MIPWDFGLINALKEKINWEIFPSESPNEIEKPYLVLEIGNTKYRFDHTILAEVNIRVIDPEIPSNRIYEFCKNLQQVLMEDLTLYSENLEIGKAAMKIDKIETTKNNQIVKLVAIIKLENMKDE